MISRIAVRFRRLRRRLSRSHLATRLFGSPLPKGTTPEPGLIMIQIDGLARSQLENAMKKGNLPFLSRLVKRGHFSLESFYSGVPSTTPAVQAEIFYGVRTAVPAFHFLRRERGEAIRMYEADAAAEIEQSIKDKGHRSVLAGGHSYSNIYRADTARSRYCAQDFAPNEILKHLHPLKSILLALVYFPKILRMIALAFLELGIAIIDMFDGLYERKNFLQELKFVPTRVAVCIVLRELIRFRILLDIERGEQIIHANFLGYDEQAHRRGPSSAFAHWTLIGIDRALRDIYRAAHRSDYRDYEIMIYSDHGQEHTEPFVKRHGRKVEEALAAVFEHGPLAGYEIWKRSSPGPELIGNTLSRCRNLLGRPARKNGTPSDTADPATHIIVAAMGPLGHIYLPEKISGEAMTAYAQALVETGGIPMVLIPCRTDGDSPRVFTSRGESLLLENYQALLGEKHPFGKEAAKDLARLCQHPDAGDFIISGWDPKQRPMSFPHENGAHGGPGSEETHGFLLVPDRIRRWHVAHLPDTGSRVRGEELRQIALHFIGRDQTRVERVPEHRPRCPEDLTVRVMSYNIHSCLGIDGKVRPERVARVINDFDPDIVAVQEVDAHRPRSHGHDQAEVIAAHLRMEHVFEAMFEEEKERYGIAIFSKFPFEIIKRGYLTEVGSRREARGAIHIKVHPEGRRPFHFINTHFGLGRVERREQVEALLGPEWLGGIDKNAPLILCGDFNSGPRSAVFRSLSGSLQDAWQSGGGYKVRPGFPSMKPFLRLDHIFTSKHFEVDRVKVPRTPTATVASDHLPLCARLILPADDSARSSKPCAHES